MTQTHQLGSPPKAVLPQTQETETHSPAVEKYPAGHWVHDVPGPYHPALHAHVLVSDMDPAEQAFELMACWSQVWHSVHDAAPAAHAIKHHDHGIKLSHNHMIVDLKMHVNATVYVSTTGQVNTAKPPLTWR